MTIHIAPSWQTGGITQKSANAWAVVQRGTEGKQLALRLLALVHTTSEKEGLSTEVPEAHEALEEMPKP